MLLIIVFVVEHEDMNWLCLLHDIESDDSSISLQDKGKFVFVYIDDDAL